MGLRIKPDNQMGAIGIALLLVIFIFGRAIYHKVKFAHDSKVLTETFDTRIEPDSVVITPFDPNTVELAELLRIGLTKYEALSIVRYRAAGKVFHIKEEVFGCYGISDSLYFALEPYIIIGEEYKYKPKTYDTSYKKSYDTKSKTTYQKSNYKSYEREPEVELTKFLVDSVGVKYLHATGVLSVRQAEVFVKWRDMSGIHTMDELRKCYVVSDECAAKLEPYVIFTPRVEEEKKWEKTLVDLNKADTSELVSVYGIGEKTALAILDYREKLGGFYSKEQLSEINIITESNFEKIITQILVDSCDISKIDVNFAPAKEFMGHPYIEPKRLRKLLKQRQLKGGWHTIEEMIEDHIFTKEEAQRVHPYLQFEQLGEFNNQR